MSRHDFTRRDFLKLGGAGAAVAAGLPWANRALAAGELIANTYGGGWEAGHRAAIATPLERKLGIKVTLASILAAEMVARTKAAKGGQPPVDVALLDDGPFLSAIKEEVLERVPADKIPNAVRIYPQYRPKEPYGLPVGASVIGLAYHAKRVKTAPASWADLWKPEYKGQVGLVTPASTLGTVFLLSVAKANGGSEANIEPGFRAIKSLLPSVGSIASSPAGLQTLLERGEVSVAPMWHSNTLILKGKGTGMEFVLPKEGGIAGLAFMAITRGANVDLAAQYINQALDPEAQRILGNPPYYFGPVIQGVTLVPEVAGVVPATPADLEKLSTGDWAVINQYRAEWINRWNREVKA